MPFHEIDRTIPIELSELHDTQISISRLGTNSGDLVVAVSPVEFINQSSSLPPVDRGLGAWSFLIATFFIDMVIWGFPSSFGIFLDAYRSDPIFQQQKNSQLLLPLIGPLSSGVMYGSAPIINAWMSKYPNYRRHLMCIGAVMSPVSLFAASYTTRIPLLLLLQGILNGFGGIFLYCPCISYISEWFVDRRGLACGIIFAGTAVGGLVLPPILPSLISKYGPQKTLRYLSVAIASLLLPALPFAKGRLPDLRSRISGPEPRGTTRAWLKNKVFWILIGANTLQGFGYFVPIVWLPTYASAIRIKPAQASIAVATMNGASFFSGLAVGYLSDTMSPWLLGLCSLTLASLTTFVLWGVFSTTFGGLLAFGIVYGLLAGGWISLWSSFTRPIAHDDPRVVTVIIGYLGLSRGIGNIFSTPISSALSLSSNNTEMFADSRVEAIGFKVEDGKYEKMILYAGTCFAGAALISSVGWIWDRRARLNQERPNGARLN
ncbi:MFS general substrate transporter [Marasmius fiardii PR-910]|nr:MFS general substrate transporter [Marasmius fiardii PR-910]